MDYLFRNIRVIDGSGKPSFTGNVGILGERLLLNPQENTADTVINGDGLHICPGFIDVHSHGDQTIGMFPMQLSKVSQGITTQIAGQCGSTAFPINHNNLALHKELISIGTYNFPDDMVNWHGLEQFRSFVERTPMVVNMKTFTGHSTLRVAVMGYDHRRPTVSQLNKMQSLFEETLQFGSMGLSTGLIYPPGNYGSTEEIIEIAKVAKEYGGFYATHVRNESDDIVAAVAEALRVGKEAEIPICISHHKVCGIRNWGKSKETLTLIHKAIDEGVQVTIDQYPYTANSTHLNAVIPPKYFRAGVTEMTEKLKKPVVREQIRKEMQMPGTYDNFYLNSGGFDGIFISGCSITKQYDGMFVSELAKKQGKDPFDALFDLLIENEGKVNAIYHCIGEEDCCRIISDCNTCIGTDGTCRTLTEQTHPRTFGAFPRAINHYVKELKLLSLEEMIYKMTGLAAERMRLHNRGIIANGNIADLVVFDYNTIRDIADYTFSTRLSDGVCYVFVNGKLAYTKGAVTNSYSGRFIPHHK